MKPATFYVLLLAFMVVQTAVGEDLRPLLEQAISARGTNYIDIRNQIVAVGSNNGVDLAAIAGKTNETWQMRLVAGICAERIGKHDAILEIAMKDWQRDPEYNPKWQESHGGLSASPEFGALMLMRYNEKALWFYYMELLWKGTEEHSQDSELHGVQWNRLSRTSVLASPCVDLLMRVLEERIMRDPDFTTFETKQEFGFLVENESRLCLPFVLEGWLRFPAPEKEKFGWMKRILEEARSDDIGLIENFSKKGGFSSTFKDLISQRLEQIKAAQKTTVFDR